KTTILCALDARQQSLLHQYFHSLADGRTTDIFGGCKFADGACSASYMTQDVKLLHTNIEIFCGFSPDMRPDHSPKWWDCFPETGDRLISQVVRSSHNFLFTIIKSIND